MFSHHISAALASEHHKTLLAQAEASHQARQLRLHRQTARLSVAHRTPLRWFPNWLLSAQAAARENAISRPVALRQQ